MGFIGYLFLFVLILLGLQAISPTLAGIALSIVGFLFVLSIFVVILTEMDQEKYPIAGKILSAIRLIVRSIRKIVSPEKLAFDDAFNIFLNPTMKQSPK